MIKIICGDCIEKVQELSDNSVNLVVTSPPYANQRKNQYGGIDEKDYASWTVAWMNSLRPKLVDNGSICIVIRPHIKRGQISDYVLRTRLAIRVANWIECEELVWIKPDSPPLGSLQRPRRAWESILWFSKSRNPFCNTKANGRISKRVGFESIKGVGDYKQGTQKARVGVARSKDYCEVGTGMVDKSEFNTHPAQFPSQLAEWIIRLLCPRDGLVVDPFMGGGSTLVAAKRLNAQSDYSLSCVGIDNKIEYCEIAKQRLDKEK